MPYGPDLKVVVAAVVVVLQAEGCELEPNPFSGWGNDDPGAIPVVRVPWRVPGRLDGAVSLEKTSDLKSQLH